MCHINPLRNHSGSPLLVLKSVEIPADVSYKCWIEAKSVDSDQGSVVQSIVSLTNLLRVILLTVLAHSIYNILIFFAEEM